MSASVETAYAKLNLALHVRRREADGYHAIETLFAFTEDGDRLELVDEPGLSLSGPFAQSLAGAGDNLVSRAAEGFANLCGRPNEHGFLLEKKLPVAAGIGGGSADAGAALRLLCARHAVDPASAQMMDLAKSLGADVPACLLSRPVRGEGKGDLLTAADGVPRGQPILLVNPLRPLATGAVFTRWDGVDRGPLDQGDAMEAARAGRNDLEVPAIAVLPIIGDVLAALTATAGALLVRMSGSGATCFAMFEDEHVRNAAHDAIVTAQPEWWLMATRLR